MCHIPKATAFLVSAVSRCLVSCWNTDLLSEGTKQNQFQRWFHCCSHFRPSRKPISFDKLENNDRSWRFFRHPCFFLNLQWMWNLNRIMWFKAGDYTGVAIDQTFEFNVDVRGNRDNSNEIVLAATLGPRKFRVSIMYSLKDLPYK